MNKTAIVFSMSVLALAACKDSGNSETNNARATTSVSLAKVLEIAPPVEVQTPKSFKTSTTSTTKSVSRSSSASDFCSSIAGEYDDPTSENAKCRAIHEVKERFFQPSPTELRAVLTGIDGAVSSMLAEGTQYLPCLDRDNTSGGSMGVGDSMEDFVAFSETQFSLSKTFADSSSFDTGVSYYLSCIRANNDASASWSGIGQKDGSTYVVMSGGTSDGLAIIDSSTNIDYWYTVNGLLSTFDPANPAEKQGPASSTYGNVLTYQGSTALVHVRSNAGSSIIELALTGSGVGDGCGARLMTDGNYLFYEANRNYYTRCSANDTTATVYDDTGEIVRLYDAAFDNLSFCFEVTGDDPINSDIANCTGRGLSSEDFYIAKLTRSDIKAYNAPYLFADMPTDVPPFKAIERPEIIVSDESDLQTYVEESIYLTRIAHITNRTAGFCKDQGSVATSAISTTYELDFSTLSTSELTAINAAYAVRVYGQVDDGFTLKSTYSYWSNFSATIDLTRNDIEAGTPISLTDDAAPELQNIAFVIEGVTFESADKLKVEMTGSSVFECSDGAPNLGSAATGVGLGRVRIAYYLPPTTNDTNNQ